VRSYGQYCSIAKALDVVGDRWSLLIIRELLIRDGLRYTDLKAGLPGIATNLLAERIRELESAGLIRREEAPPPVATTLFRLTEAGSELLPVLNAIGRWGVRFMADPVEDDVFRGEWFAFPVSLFLHDRDPEGPSASIELRAASSPAVVEISGGSVQMRLGTAAAPDVVLEGEPRLILGMFTGILTVNVRPISAWRSAAMPACWTASCRKPPPRGNQGAPPHPHQPGATRRRADTRYLAQSRR
jgi:DNA-binding HxlR family transcriptional regulator